jgi:hypothetical protein
MEKFTPRQLAEIKQLLSECSDEELYTIFSPVYDTVREALIHLRRRPKAESSNSSPYGIADEVHRN